MRMFGWLWNRWKNCSRAPRKPKHQPMPRHKGRRLALESLETRRMLDGSIASILASDTPNPHPTGDPPSATAQVITLTSYTAPQLPFESSGDPDIEQFIQGLQQIYSNISSNPQARPTYWGEVAASGGGQYELHLCDNGMLVTAWTVNWGDGSNPQTVPDSQLWVMHTYAGNTSQYTITVTANSVDGSYAAGIGTTPGALDSNFDGTISETGGPPADWSSPGNPHWSQAGANGQQTTNFESGNGFDQAAAVTSDDGNILVVGTTANGQFGLVRYMDDPGQADDGNPDTSFGTNGMVTTTFSIGNASASAVVVDSSHATIVVAGTVVDSNGDNEVALARYNDADGSLDTTFGTGGLVTVDLGPGWTSTNAVAVQSDGSILVAGCLNGQFAVLHFNSDGTQDMGFGGGSNGVATASFGGTDETPAAMAINSNGLILVAGTTTQANTGQDFALAQFNTDGTLDADGFGLGGTITTDFGGNDVATSIAIQPATGNILVAGYTEQNGSTSFAIARYIDSHLSGLVLDEAFGTNGLVTTSFGDGDDIATGVAVDSDGNIIVCGSTLLDGNDDVDSVPHFAVARYLTDGTLDSSFGAGTGAPTGTVTTDFTGLGFTTDSAVGMFIDANGRLIVAGTATQQDFSSFAVSCYDPGISPLGLQVSDVAPVLQACGSQVTTTGQQIDLSPIAQFTHAPVTTGTFSYQIDWGDGKPPDTGTATIVDPGSDTSPLVGVINDQHTYMTAGTYYVAVTVTDPNGGSDEQSVQVTVNASAPAVANVPPPSTTAPGDPGQPPPLYGDPDTTGSGGSQVALAAPTQSDSDGSIALDSGQALSGSQVSNDDVEAGQSATNDDDDSSMGAQAALADSVTGVPTDPALVAAIDQALAIPANQPLTTADMARLTSLTADSNQVLSLQGLQNAVNLQSLTLVPTSFADPGHLTDLSPLAGLTNLKTLTLQDCGIGDAVLDNSSTTLPTLPALQTLDLRYNNINTIPPQVAQLPSLTSLLIYGNPLTNNPRAGLAALAGRLVTVDIAPDHPEDAINLYDPTNPSTAQNVYNDLADAFYDLPLAIYQYVVNTIQYQPYQGAQKGPLAVLQTGAGNDWDTDSLLALLLQRASQQAVLQGNAAISVDFAWGQVLETLTTTEQRLAVRTAAAAYDTLNLAGLRPAFLNASSQTVDPTTGLSSAVYAEFDHAWLQVGITAPGATTATTYMLDPSWKMLDLQPGVPNVANSNMLNVQPFTYATASSSGAYLSSTANENETAAEFYEAQVSLYLSQHDAGMTIADVAYTGSIQQQTFTSLPMQLPFLGYSILSSGASIPSNFVDQVRISVEIPQSVGTLTCTGGTDGSGNTITTLVASQGAPFAYAMAGAPIVINTPTGARQTYTIDSVQSGTSVSVLGTATFGSGDTLFTPAFSSLQIVPNVCLERITIGYAAGSGSYVSPELLINGNTVASNANVSVASGSNVDLVVQTIQGGYGLNYSGTDTYPRTAGEYIAIGLDAWQISNSMLVSDRQIVNNANIAEANNADWDQSATNYDQLAGGLLALAMTDFFLNSDQGDESIADLTDAMPVYNCIAQGIATANTAVTDNDGNNDDLQIRYLPASGGVDIPGSNWNSVSIDETAITTAQTQRSFTAEDVSHYALMGYTSSAEEALVWEDLTNTQSISTTKSLQMAYQPGSGYSVVLVTSANLGTVFSTSVPYGALKDLAGTEIQTDITGFVNSGFGVLVPSAITPVNNTTETWNGVGYFLLANNGDGIDEGNIIDTGDGDPHGGWFGGNADTVSDVTSPVSTGDPIDISNGSVSHAETDFSIPNLGQPLSFSRNYSSDNTVGPTGTAWSDRGMGEGWSFTYSDEIATPAALGDPADQNTTTDPANELIWFTDQGVELKFTPNGSGGYNNPPTLFGALTAWSASGQTGYLWTDTSGQEITFTSFTVNGVTACYVTQIADRYGNGVAIARDPATAHILTVSDLFDRARCLTFTYTGNHIASISAFTGQTWLYDYDSAGRLVSVTAPITSTSPLNLTQYAYYPEGSIEQGLLETVTDPDGNVTQFAYYVNRRGFQVTDATGDTQTVSDDIYLNRADVTDERGQMTSYVYDSQGNEIEQINPDNTTLAYTWGSDPWDLGLKTSDTDEYGQPETYSYYSTANSGNPTGDYGNLYQYTNRLGETTTYTYTTYGNPLTVTNNVDGGVTTNTYNTNGSLSSTTDADGNTTYYCYPGTPVYGGSGTILGTNRGQPAETVAANGTATWYVYNPAGQTTAQYATLVNNDGAPPIPVTGTYSGVNAYVTESWSYDNAGDLLSSTDGNGNVTTNTYDALGDRTSETQPAPEVGGSLPAPVTDYVYDAAGNLISTTAVTGSPQTTTSTVYDSMGRVVETINPDGTYTTAQYDQEGNLVYSTDAMGRVTQYVYDSRNRQIATINPDGSVVSTEYDGGGRVVAETDANGNTTTYTYDPLGRKLSVTAPSPTGSGTATTQYYYDDAHDKQYVTDAQGTGHTDVYHTTETDYDKLGNVIKVIQPVPATGQTAPVTSDVYDADGNVVYETDPRGNTTQYLYDALDRRTAVVPPALNPAAIAPVDGNSATLSGTNWSGSLSGGYDNTHRTFSGFWSTSATWTLTGLSSGSFYEVFVTWVANAGNTTAASYTVFNGTTSSYQGSWVTANVNQQNSPLANPIFTDACGWLRLGVYWITGSTLTVELQNPYGGDLDADSIRVVQVDPTISTYDADGNVTATTNALDVTTINVYDNLDREIETIQPDPATGQTSQGDATCPKTYVGYDANGNVVSTTDANGNTTTYAYNLAGQQTAVTDALGDTTTTVYDAVGNVLSVTDALGRMTTFQYDAMNRKTEETDPLPASTASSAPQTTWAYDQNGNVTSTTDPNGNTTWTQYNHANLPVAVTDALGAFPGDPQHTITTTYDILGQVLTTTDQLGRVTTYQYDNLGRKIAVYAPDPTTGQDTANSPTTYYGYDADGNLKYVTTPMGATNAGGTGPGDWNYTTWYFYDSLDRQVCVIYPQSTVSESWTPSTVPDTISLATQPDKSTITTFTALGQVSTVTDQLGNTTSYRYDDLGRKIEELDPSVTVYPVGGGTPETVSPITAYVYDLNGNLLSTTDPDGHTTWTLYDALNRPIKTVSADGSGPNDTHYATTTTYDAVGNTLSVTDPDGNVTSYQYDRLDRQIQVANPLWFTSTTQYDLDGNVVQATDFDGQTTQYVYDPLNQQVEEDWVAANGSVFHTIQTFYDAAGQVLGVSESDENPSNATSYQYSYDQDGNTLSSRMAPGDLAQSPGAVYTPSGSLGPTSSTIDWTQDGTQERYQNLGYITLTAGQTVLVQLTSTAFATAIIVQPPGGNQTNWLIAKSSDGNSSWLMFTVGSAQAGNWYFAATSPSATASGNFAMQVTVDPNPLLPTALTELDYTYYADGSVHTVTDKSNVSALSGNTATTTYSYTPLAQVASISQSGTDATAKQVQFEYNDDGSVNTVTTSYGTTPTQVAVGTYTYNNDGLLTNLAYTHNGSAIDAYGKPVAYSLEYDAAGNITQQVSADGTDDYTLDNDSQETAASLTGEGYSYDQNGNRTGGGYVTGADNRLLSDGTYCYQYDANGNRIARWEPATAGALETQPGPGDTYITFYTYDYENRLTSETNYYNWTNYGLGIAMQTVTYTYDYLGNIIRDYASAAPQPYTYTVYGGQNPYLQVSDATPLSGSGTPQISQRYLYGPAVDQILATDSGGGNVLWGLADYAGTIRDDVNDTVTNNWGSDAVQNHVEFNSFGEVTNGTVSASLSFGQNGMRYESFTSQYFTETDVYDPIAERRLSEDDIGFLSGTTNLTAWAGNSPVQNADLTGECAQAVFNPPVDYGSLGSNNFVSRTIGSFGAVPGGINLNPVLQSVGPAPDTDEEDDSPEGLDVARDSLQTAINQTGWQQTRQQILDTLGSDPNNISPDAVAKLGLQPELVHDDSGFFLDNYTMKAVVSLPNASGGSDTIVLREVDPWFGALHWVQEGPIQLNVTASQAEAAIAARDDQIHNGIMDSASKRMQIEGGLYMAATGPVGAMLGLNQAGTAIVNVATGGNYDTPIATGASNWVQYVGGYNQTDARTAGGFIDNGLAAIGASVSSPWTPEPQIVLPGNGPYPTYLDTLSLQQSLSGFRNVNDAGIDLTLPAYDGTTQGLLYTNEGNLIPLSSGNADPAFANYPAAFHVEGKAAIVIRTSGSSGGVVYINHPQGTCGFCNSQVPTLLPEGVPLMVVPPPGTQPSPGWYVNLEPYAGNSATPKPNLRLGK